MSFPPPLSPTAMMNPPGGDGDGGVDDHVAAQRIPAGGNADDAAVSSDGDHNPPWVHRLFLSDGRMRCRERYSRHLSRRRRVTEMDEMCRAGKRRGVIHLLPDAKFWRVYLPLIERLFQVEVVGDGDSWLPRLVLRWVLLESAAEALDARTATPGVVVEDNDDDGATVAVESAATNERSRICRLVEDSSSGRGRVDKEDEVGGADDAGPAALIRCEAVAFPDLSIRTATTSCDDDDDGNEYGELEDEFDLLDYGDMPTLPMCQRALGRAARLFVLESSSSSTTTSGDKKRGERSDISPPPQSPPSPAVVGEVVMLSDDPSVRRDVAMEDEGEDHVGGGGCCGDGGGRITVLTDGEELISFIGSRLGVHDGDERGDVRSSDIGGVLSSLRETAVQCELDYRRRNSPPTGMTDRLDGFGSGAYLPYKSLDEVKSGLESKLLFRGKLDVDGRNVREGYVTVHHAHDFASSGDGRPSTTMRYFLDQSLRMFNRALPGDVVVVEPLPEGLWRSPVGRRRLVHHQQHDGDPGGVEGKVVDLDESPVGPPVPTARVVAILRPNRRTYVATIVEGDDEHRRRSGLGGGGDAAILVVPMDVRVPKIRIRPRGGSSSLSTLRDHRLLVRIDGWDVDSDYPHGHVENVVGPCNDLETEVSCLLHECDLDDVRRPFGPAALACLPQDVSDETMASGEWTIPPRDLEGRRDLRDASEYRVFSVDPPGCQDIDDTMHVRRLPNGNVEVGVHIADVDRFVPQNCALDREAALRGTTFYLVDRRYDMLPTVLSSNLCSLHGGVDRLAVSCIWELEWPSSSSSGRGDDGGDDIVGPSPTVKSCWFGRTVIRNCAAMTYDQAHRILEGKAPDAETGGDTHPPPPLTAGGPVDPDLVPHLRSDLEVLTDLARRRRSRREREGGAIDLSGGGGGGNEARGSELKFTLDPDTGEPVKVTGKTEMEIHATVAELMIMANSTVARRIYDRFPLTALLRTHRPVEDELKLDELDETFRAASGGEISLLRRDREGDGGGGRDGATKMTLAEALRRARGDAALEALFQSLAARAMSEARYVCTGTVLEEAVRRGVVVDDERELFSHYGLGVDEYTHFTSPIRRYADVVVHRLLLASLAPPPAMMETGLDAGGRRRGDGVADDSRHRGRGHTVPQVDLVPASNVMSVLRDGDEASTGAPSGGGTTNLPSDFSDDDGGSIDELIEGAADLALGGDGKGATSSSVAVSSKNADDVLEHPAQRADATAVTITKGGSQNIVEDGPYASSREVAAICDRLNHQNRMSKIASTDCQNLFLSLYLMGHVEYAEAVVVGLRQNGVVVYVPRFDLKAPLYLSDRDGNVHIDPLLVGLPPSAGLPPSSGFAAAGAMRMFSHGICTLHNDDAKNGDEDEEGAWVGVSVPNADKEFVLRRLDVLTVQLSSADASESRARVPPPRVHLLCKDRHPIIGSPAVHRVEEAHKTRLTSTSFGGEDKTNEENEVPNRMDSRHPHPSAGSMKCNDITVSKSLYEITRSIEITPDPVCCSRAIPGGSEESSLSGQIVKAADRDRLQTVPGRFVYGDFRNPDTATAMKEAAVTAAAAAASSASASPRRKNQGGGDGSTGYDESRRIEREVTARTQRLAAVKRSARRAKAGK